MRCREIALHTARRSRREVIGWSLGLVLLVAWIGAVFPSIRGNDTFSQLVEDYPEVLRRMLGLSGVDITSGPGYLKTELFSFMLPLVLVIFGVAFGARALASEEESGTIDLLMSAPVPRRSVVLGKALAYALVAAVLDTVVFAAVWVASVAFGLGVAVARLAAAMAVVGLLAAHFTAIALAVGALTGRRATAIATASGLGVAGFVWNGLTPLTDTLAHWRSLSPFAWAFDNDPLAGSASVGSIALLTAAIMLWLAVAVLAFEQRDLGT